jgi:hypothetical protein
VQSQYSSQAYVLVGALQKKFAKRSSPPALGGMGSTFSTSASVLLSGEARLEAAIVATMKLRRDVASMLNTKPGHALALVKGFD